MPSRSTVTVARHGRLPRSHAWVSVLALLTSAIAVILVSGVSVAAFAAYDVAAGSKPGVALIGHTNEPATISAREGAFNVLVAASDSGGGDIATYGKRGEHLNDVTMLLHVSEDHTRATVISFPRDLVVQIASCPNGKGGDFASQVNKINVALTYGGLPCIVKTVENLTGLSIPFAALTEFQGVVGMSDAVGGVAVCIATAIHDEQIHFDLGAGQQTIQGEQAVQFLRVRYGLGDGSDLARVSNQQLFLSALVRKIKTADTLSNPIKVYQLAKAAADNMQMSDNLKNVNTLASMAIAVKGISIDDTVFVQYPNSYATQNGKSVVLPVKNAADLLTGAIKTDTPIVLSGNSGAGTTLDPSATTPPAPSTSASPSTDASAAPALTLPRGVHGQTAAQQTCTKGQRAKG